jgi:hypothetical protein
MTARGTLVYVHGASDRAVQVDDHVALIEQQLAAHGMRFQVVASRWGEAVGATLDRIHLAIPTAHGPAIASDEDDALERLLRDGPLAGLAGLARRSGTDTAPSFAPPAVRDADRLLAIAQSTRDAALADPPTIAPDALEPPIMAIGRRAAEAVRSSPEYSRARRAAIPEAELVAETARALAAAAATAANRATGLPESATSGAAPDRRMPNLDAARSIELRIAEVVLAAAAGTLLAGYIGIDVGPGLRRWATDILVPHRARLMREGFLGPADILLYLRAGDPIRRFVKDSLASAAAAGPPTIALGQSMGGVVLFDALRDEDAPRPDLLVTIGSQAPLLQTLGALDGMGTRPPFQPWLNIYDVRDFLAFVAQPVWPDERGISDVAVDLGVGFPESHGSAYLSEPDVYRAIRDHPALER